ncbi:MAG: hypothetical protein QOE61_2016 [Micromonosporaceae bacterium]|nr:hypothetical protein [Micromonosporaceae bacterium]
MITELATRSVHGAQFTAELRTVFGEILFGENLVGAIVVGEIQAKPRPSTGSLRRATPARRQPA